MNNNNNHHTLDADTKKARAKLSVRLKEKGGYIYIYGRADK